MIRFPERAQLSDELKRRVDAAADEAVRCGGLESITALAERLDGFDGLARRALLRTLLREHFESLSRSGGVLPGIASYFQQFADEAEQSIVREVFAEQLPALRLELVREIGRGGMGVIYEARQTNVGGRRVAVKMLDIGAANQAFLWNRLREEVDVLAQIDSPHVVKVFEVGLIDGHLGFVMELADENLQQRTSGHPQDQRIAAQIVVPLAVAVQAAHDHPRRLIHQDLKPSNVLVFRGLEYKVADFGLHRAVDDRPAAEGRVLGSPGWLAPEQARGEPPTFATDVWGLGAILYFLLTGSAPFAENRERIQDVASQAMISPAVKREQAGGDPLDARLEAITRKCLSKDPKQRYRRPIEVADELRRYLNAEPVLAAVPVQPRRRQRLPLFAAVLAVCAIGAVLSVTQPWQSWWNPTTPEKTEPEHATGSGEKSPGSRTDNLEPESQKAHPEGATSTPASAHAQTQPPATTTTAATTMPAADQPTSRMAAADLPDPLRPPGQEPTNIEPAAPDSSSPAPVPAAEREPKKAVVAPRPDLSVFTREFPAGQGGLPGAANFTLAKTPDLLDLAPPDLRNRLDGDESAEFVESWGFEMRRVGRGTQEDMHFTRTLKVRYRDNDALKEETLDVRTGECSRQMAQRYFKPGVHRFVIEPQRKSIDGNRQFFDEAGKAMKSGLFKWKGDTRNHYEISIDGEQWIVWSLTPKKE